MKKIIFFVVIGVLLLSCEKEKINIEKILSQEEINEAMNYGKENASLTFTEFTEKWSVGYEYEYGKG
ncbi:MAG: hypothetical protein NC917_03380, partial [Candidatus Omnitrophica bacterium]|nr:hypothetical protein [Candidatus Omnitrophota bacterium]